MKSFIISVVGCFLILGCANDMFLVIVDPNPNGSTEVLYVPTSQRQVNESNLDTSSNKLDALVKNLDTAAIKDFGEISNRYLTPLSNCDENYAFAQCDWDMDGQEDLVAINRKGFISTDMYILSGASEYKGFLLQQPIGLPKTDNSTDFAFNDFNNDGTPDLYVFVRGKGKNLYIKVLSGRKGPQGPPFFTVLKQYELDIQDHYLEKTFQLHDVNYDNIADLIVIDPFSNEDPNRTETRVSVYSGKSEFKTLIKNNATATHNTSLGVKYLMHDFIVKNNLDLLSIHPADPAKTRINVFRGATNYRVFATRDTITLPEGTKDASFFATDQLPGSSPSNRQLSFTQDKEPIIGPGTGAKDLTTYLGNWELHGFFHNGDGNGRTAIIIEENLVLASQKGKGWQGLTFTFEDLTKIDFLGKDGNVASINQQETYTLTPVDNNHFYIIDSKGYHMKVDRYLPDMNKGFLIVHNGSGYVARVWAEWVEIGFGGTRTLNRSDTTALAIPIVSELFQNDKIFKIPVDAIDITIYYQPLPGGEPKRIENPPIDNGCYQLVGTLFDPDYNRECKASRREMMQEKAESVRNSDLIKEAGKTIGKLVSSGQLTTAGFNKDDPSSYDGARNMILTPKLKKIINSEGSGIAMNYEPTDEYYALANPKNEIFLKASLASLFQNPFISYEGKAVASRQISSMSLGVGGSAEFFIGVSTDIGVVWNFKDGLTKGYYSLGPTIGLDIGAEVYLAAGFWMKPVEEMPKGDGWLVGFSWEEGFLVGGGVIIWIDFEGKFEGFSIVGLMGVEGDAGNVDFIHTWYY